MLCFESSQIKAEKEWVKEKIAVNFAQEINIDA